MAPAFVHAFQTLESAVTAHDDALARSIALGIRARGPGPVEVRLLESFERVLDGRELLRGVTLELIVHPADGAEFDGLDPSLRVTHVLALRAEHEHATPLSLHLPPATLRRVRTASALRFVPEGAPAEGAEPQPGASDSRSLESHVFPGFDGLALPVGESVEVPLLAFECSAGASLAVRERWSLETRSGQLRRGDESLPAQDPKVAPVEVVARAAYLPTDPVPPEELLRYARGVEVSIPALMERAVRIDNSRRVEAALLLADAVDEFSGERLAELAPALRWLTGSGEAGGDPRSWRLRLESASAVSARETDTRGGLDLPGRR